MIYGIYLGAVGSIIILNAVQGILFRSRIYGLFTIQTTLWFVHALSLGIGLSQPMELAAHTQINGLVIICYLELVHQLLPHQFRNELRQFRWIQGGVLVYLLLEVGLMVAAPDNWRNIALHRYLSFAYWLVLVWACAMGIRIAARQRDAVGRFFVAGSLLLLLNEARGVVFYGITLLGDMRFLGEYGTDTTGQVIAGGFILELLCFSLCLVFHQRQLSVAQAVQQTRIEEQLEQERLQAELTQQRLEQESMEGQLRALQTQVNPHFLFNALNSLSSLIGEAPQQAEVFVDKLSNVYRYLLRANEQPLTTVSAELAFIEAYYHLLQTRYGNGLTLSVTVDPAYHDFLIPPLTLQLLVENAVKHNVVSSKRPLYIRIATTEAGELTVSNTLQKKQSRVLSNGVGLSNIVAKYKMLNLPALSVIETTDTFTVSLPLLNEVTA